MVDVDAFVASTARSLGEFESRVATAEATLVLIREALTLLDPHSH